MKRAAAGLTIAFALIGRTALADKSSTSIEQGYDQGDVAHPRSIALAGAQQVFGGSTSAVFVNPANLALYKVYHVEGLAAVAPEARRQSYGGAIADSSTSNLSGGFGGTYNVMDPDGIKRAWTDLRAALAYPLGDRVSIGLGGRYLRLQQRVAAGPLGASLASDGTKDDPLFSRLTFDAGLAVNITENLRAAVSGQNLTATGTGIAPLTVGGGLGYSNKTLTLEADSVVDFNTFATARARYMAGGELLLADRFPLRAGYRYDDGMKTSSIGIGAGYVDRRFSIEIGGRRDVAGDRPNTIISLGIRFFIELNNGGQLEQPDNF